MESMKPPQPEFWEFVLPAAKRHGIFTRAYGTEFISENFFTGECVNFRLRRGVMKSAPFIKQAGQ
jgi:hypothetical protein